MILHLNFLKFPLPFL
uniref:Uncharacterized protein n=1 Tax=Rhizophora mucronata TaxID=61149 RepID=A0A2P2N8Y9_RHIMU